VDFLFNLLVFLHFVGLASLLGGWLVQMSSSTKVINNAMLHGVLTQVVTGIAMVGLLSSKVVGDDDEAVDNTKVGIKLAVALAVLVVVLLGRRKPEDQQKGYWAAAGALTLVNVAVAVFVSFL
jgi:cytochrome bd-type quinol oxidase subunit 2